MTPESESLIHGDGSVAQDALVEVMFMEEPACFTGAFVMTLDHARELLHEFIRAGTTGGRAMTPL